MAYIGGDVKEIFCSHPTVGDFRYEVKSGEDFTIDRGGIKNADDNQNVTGNGTMILIKNQSLWSCEGTIMSDFDSDEQESSFEKMTESAELGTWTFTLADGTVLQGKGIPVGDSTTATQTALKTIKIQGGGKLSKI